MLDDAVLEDPARERAEGAVRAAGGGAQGDAGTRALGSRRACRLTGHSSEDREARARARLPRDPRPDARDRRRAPPLRHPWIGLTLEREGVATDRKTLRRLHEEEGLAVRRRGRKRATGTREPMPVPAAPGERRSLDLRADVFGPGRRFARHRPRTDGGPRLALAVIDDHTRECPALAADTSISGERVGLLGSTPWSGSTGRAGDHRQRQRNRTHEPRDPALAGQGRGRPAPTSPRASRPGTPSSRASTGASGTNASTSASSTASPTPAASSRAGGATATMRGLTRPRVA